METFFVVMAVLYFLPTIVAACREKQNGISIWIANVFFGWTVVGWIICLVWAFSTSQVDMSAKSEKKIERMQTDAYKAMKKEMKKKSSRKPRISTISNTGDWNLCNRKE